MALLDILQGLKIANENLVKMSCYRDENSWIFNLLITKEVINKNLGYYHLMVCFDPFFGFLSMINSQCLSKDHLYFVAITA